MLTTFRWTGSCNKSVCKCQLHALSRESKKKSIRLHYKCGATLLVRFFQSPIDFKLLFTVLNDRRVNEKRIYAGKKTKQITRSKCHTSGAKYIHLVFKFSKSITLFKCICSYTLKSYVHNSSLFNVDGGQLVGHHGNSLKSTDDFSSGCLFATEMDTICYIYPLGPPLKIKPNDHSICYLHTSLKWDIKRSIRLPKFIPFESQNKFKYFIVSCGSNGRTIFALLH